ncbi:MAG TPA: BMP family ABC transporter substrate-binding protein [Candidatus Deferrimicrobium sp.]|nr:BMP family ABC transporter substrate-binding protein [Candidatus Deferrimicrobium sp.]
MQKKILVFLVVALMLVGLVGCGKTETPAPTPAKPEAAKLKVGMATDVGGVNDESFNASANRGLLKAQSDLGAEIKVLESKQEADYDTNLATLVRGGNELTWGIGFAMANAIQKAATDNPDKKFGIVDSAYDKIPSNVTCVTFKEEEGSFLMGVIAAKMTKTNKVGFLGGVEIDLIKKFEYGFRAGVAAVNPKIEVKTGYAASFTDSAKGKSISNAMYDQGVDVIFHASGGVGKGLFEAAQEKSKGGNKVWAIGVDSDQYKLAPENTLSSMIKSVDNAVFDVTKRLKDGKWKGGEIITYGLKEGGIDIAPTTNKNTPKEVIDVVNQFKDKIIKGEIVVPATKADYDTYFAKLAK